MAKMDLQRSDFVKICRTCLSSKDGMNSIYTPEVLQMLHTCTNIKVHADDNLPTLICTDCTDQVNKSYSFKTLCENSDQILQQILISYEEDLKCNVDDDDGDIKLEYTDDSSLNDESFLETVQTEQNPPEAKPVRKKARPRKKLRKDARVKLKHNCEDCSRVFKSVHDLARHVTTTHGVHEPLTCGVCKQVFLIQTQLDLHMKRHQEPKTLACGVCSRIFNNTGNLRRHERIHQTRERDYVCQICDKSFIEEPCLKAHNKRYHEGTNRERQVCTVCGKSVLYLKFHMIQRHSVHKPFKCEQCGESYPLKCYLKQHIIRKHEKQEKLYKALCSTCGRRFTSEAEAKRHMVTHTDEYAFACNMCEKKYKWRKHLKEHLRTHTNERPFVCSYCEKGFNTSKTLKNHLRTHTGERPYVCQICGRAFTQNCGLKTHLKIHY